MKIPESIYQRQSGLSVLMGIIFVFAGLIMFSQGYSGTLIGIVTILFVVCLISLGSRKVINNELFVEWFAAQIYNQVEKTNYVIPKEELRLDILYDIYKYQTVYYEGLKGFSDYLRFNPQFESVIGDLISNGYLAGDNNTLHIPKDKLQQVKELLDSDLI